MNDQRVPADQMLGYASGIRLLTDRPGKDSARRATAGGAFLFGDGRLDGLRVLVCGHLGKPTDLCCARLPGGTRKGVKGGR